MIALWLSLTACDFQLTQETEARAPETRLPPAAAGAAFWDVWGDGKAELDGYRLLVPRYGELRRGEAVQIWVTETFTAGQRVKSDGGHPDEFPVLKLNDVRPQPQRHVRQVQPGLPCDPVGEVADGRHVGLGQTLEGDDRPVAQHGVEVDVDVVGDNAAGVAV